MSIAFDCIVLFFTLAPFVVQIWLIIMTQAQSLNFDVDFWPDSFRPIFDLLKRLI